jgi:hypothetical protein
LTTQINIDGDEYLHDDFAFATRDGLIPEVRRSADPAEVRARGLNAPFAEITFDFVLPAGQTPTWRVSATERQRTRKGSQIKANSPFTVLPFARRRLG